MAYRVFWHVSQQILGLELEGNLDMLDFAQINQAVIDHLDSCPPDKHVTLLVDITRPGRPPQRVAQLKESQTYVRRPDLKSILIAGNNKFMRLIMLLTFNLCRPNLRFFDTVEQALMFAQRTANLDRVVQAEGNA